MTLRLKRLDPLLVLIAIGLFALFPVLAACGVGGGGGGGGGAGGASELFSDGFDGTFPGSSWIPSGSNGTTVIDSLLGAPLPALKITGNNRTARASNPFSTAAGLTVSCDVLASSEVGLIKISDLNFPQQFLVLISVGASSMSHQIAGGNLTSVSMPADGLFHNYTILINSNADVEVRRDGILQATATNVTGLHSISAVLTLGTQAISANPPTPKAHFDNVRVTSP